MREYATNQSMGVEALLLPGDNWYGWLSGGVDSSRWTDQFEDVYPADVFPGKRYAVLGNHDYENRPDSKAIRGRSRWTMPAKWYSFSFPERDPMIRWVALDSDYHHGHHFFDTPTLTHQERTRRPYGFEMNLPNRLRRCTRPFSSTIRYSPTGTMAIRQF